MVEMSEFRVVVFVPTLVSRGRTFKRSKGDSVDGMYGTLYVSAGELHEELALCRDWPADARIVTERVSLRTLFADGETKVGGRKHEVCHGVKLDFVLSSPVRPKPGAWPHRWAVKSITEVDDG